MIPRSLTLWPWMWPSCIKWLFQTLLRPECFTNTFVCSVCDSHKMQAICLCISVIDSLNEYSSSFVSVIWRLKFRDCGWRAFWETVTIWLKSVPGVMWSLAYFSTEEIYAPSVVFVFVKCAKKTWLVENGCAFCATNKGQFSNFQSFKTAF